MKKYLIWLLFALQLAQPFAFAGTSDTKNVVPASNASFLTDLQIFLKGEDADRFVEQGATPFVFSGGTHSTGAGLVGTPASLIAYPGGHRTTETGSITYPDNDIGWVIAHKDTSGNVGTFTRIAGTHYLIDFVSAVIPTLPVNSVWLMEVTTAAGAITSVGDLRNFFPLFSSISLGLVYASQYGDCNEAITAIGSTQATIVVGKSCIISTTVTAPATLSWRFEGQGDISPDATKTLTILGTITAPNRQVFKGSGTVTIGASALQSVVKATWWVDFSTMIAALGSNVVTVEVWDSEAVGTNEAVLTTMTLHFIGSGKLDVATTIVVTINGPGSDSWPSHQIFKCVGSEACVVFGTGFDVTVIPHWWDVTTGDDSFAFNAAVAALPVTGGLFRIPPGSYNNINFTLPRFSSIKGDAAFGSILNFTGGTAITLLANPGLITISDLLIVGPGIGTGIGIGGALSGGSPLVIRDVFIQDCLDGFNITNAFHLAFENTKVQSCTTGYNISNPTPGGSGARFTSALANNVTVGFDLTDLDAPSLDRVIVDGFTGTPPFIGIKITNNVVRAGPVIIGGWFSIPTGSSNAGVSDSSNSYGTQILGGFYRNAGTSKAISISGQNIFISGPRSDTGNVIVTVESGAVNNLVVGVPDAFYADLSGNTSNIQFSADQITHVALRSTRGISSTSLASNNLKGSVTFASSGTAIVTFSTAEGNGNYEIFPGATINEAFWVTGKGTAGFTMHSSNGSSTATIGWLLIR